MRSSAEMTPKERMLAAFRKQQTDTVPVAPDIYAMIPCRLTGKPFWEVFYDNDPPLWRAYLDAVRFFKMDGWFIYGGVHLKPKRDSGRGSPRSSRARTSGSRSAAPATLRRAICGPRRSSISRTRRR